MTLNPSAAAGLEACTPAQARIHSEVFGVACPSGSELGTVSLERPDSARWLADGQACTSAAPNRVRSPAPHTRSTSSPTRHATASRSASKAKSMPNEATGQLTTVFNENPEQPFSNLTINFNRGVLTSVANPLICGIRTAAASFTPVAAVQRRRPRIRSASPSPAARRRSRSRSSRAQNTNRRRPRAHSSYTFNLARPEGQQYLQKVKTTLPSGLVGEIPTSRCAANRRLRRARAAASKIGTATVTAGSGSSPYTFTGPVYMTGPYNGAPFGLSIAVPAVAGPFNLGHDRDALDDQHQPDDRARHGGKRAADDRQGHPAAAALAQRERQQAGLPAEPDQLRGARRPNRP